MSHAWRGSCGPAPAGTCPLPLSPQAAGSLPLSQLDPETQRTEIVFIKTRYENTLRYIK